MLNNENSLVTTLMKARYFPDCDFLQAKVGANPSYMWRSIVAAQGIVRQGSRKKIGKGESTSAWRGPWLPCRTNGYFTTAMPPELEHIQVVNLIEPAQK